MLKQKYFLTGIFILSAERQPIKLAWRKIVWLHKQELAQMYFPDLTIRASVNKLRRWMRRCKPLMNEILSTDFHPKTKAFSVREVRLITYLGKPGEL